MYNPFDSSAKFGAAFMKWMNDLVKTLGIDISSLKNSILNLTQRTERVLDQSNHFDDVDAKIVELQEKLSLLAADGVDNELKLSRGGYASLADRLDALDPGNVLVEKRFISTEGQQLIDLTDTGKCSGKEKIMMFLINGAPQYSSYEWVSPTQLKMKDEHKLIAGQTVIIRYFAGNITMRSGHRSGHEAGGYDPLDLYKLKNGDIVKQQLEVMQKSTVNDWRDVVAYYGVPQKVVSNASALIQKAIDECAPLGITVVIPEGDYYMEKYLVARKGLTMIINKNATFHRYHNDAMLMNGDRGGLAGQDDIWIDGGTWDLRGHLLGYDGSGFAFGYAQKITLRNAKVLNVNFSHGVELAAVEDVDLEYCDFNGFIDNTGTREYAESIQIEAGTRGGFPYFGNGANQLSKRIRIKGCTAGASDVAGTWPVGIGTHTPATVIVADDIYISQCDYTEVSITGIVSNGYKSIDVDRVKIESKLGIKVAGDGITETNFTLRDSNIRAIDGAAVYLYGVTKSLIDHNTLDGYTNAIYGIKSKKIDITNQNDLSGQASDAVSFSDDCSDINTERNIVRKAGRHAFNAYENVTHLRFRDNEILDATVNAFNFQGKNAVGIIAEGNKIKDTTLNAVVSASPAVSAMIFTKNYYPASLTNPIQSSAVNSDTTGNKAI
ncbi:right-handed parallel beta-helix repeat-containing protein [Priestia megaterium]|uniref:right-handed parallel beta-helix repeat-containing protein n=1 Tax=Priestia megaterium TaxID=1404 RepID=UPI0010AD6175|nr:right-handed parallel beta-helix repeat-containing protein [Priestia megaterium]TJZ40388.1 right-handed parallel beta-helix repeat-containing protein [Priestia megaterium]